MSDSDRRSKPDTRVDGALASWPERERSPLEWDEAASRVVARIRSSLPAKTKTRIGDDELLGAPLPPEPGEPSDEAIDALGEKSSTQDVRDPSLEGISPPASRNVLEGGRMSMSSEQRQRDRSSFKDLAKLAATPAPSSARMPAAPSSSQGQSNQGMGGDSGIVDFKQLAALDPRGAERAQSTPLAAQGLFDDDVSGPAAARMPSSAPPPPSGVPASGFLAAQAQPAPASSPAPSVRAPLSSPAPAVMAVPSVPSVPGLASPPVDRVSAAAMVGLSTPRLPASSSPSLTPKKSRGGLFAAVGGLVFLAAAAGGVLFVKSKHPELLARFTHHAAAPAPAAPATTTAVAAATTPAPQETAAAPADTTNDAVAQNDDTTTADDDQVAAAGKPVAKSHHHAKTVKPSAKEAASPPPQEEAKAAPAPKEKDPNFAPTGTGQGLGDAMNKAVGKDPNAADQTPAAQKTGPQFAAGTVPQKPATGAVTGALMTVMPNARACLGPDDPISRVTVEFASEGTPKRIAVSGAAAGKPTETCIKAAFQHAKLPPFAEPSFTTTVTVRP